ncbi:MAG: hypothetical protein NZ528_14775 [Caldilineales bacterium]|nr:hypothetical protein [Caldilineales bacterium]MDW8318677.1 hypothetical protein [Anaerolineae bacterium]
MFTFPFELPDEVHEPIAGELILDAPSPCDEANRCYRYGWLALRNGRRVELVLTHSRATAQFMYGMQQSAADPYLFDLLGLAQRGVAPVATWLAGQLILGAPRARIIGVAIRDALCSPAMQEALSRYSQDAVVILPVLREGAKFQMGEGVYETYGYYCDEALLDSHHVYDPTVPRYNRRVETTILKDQDISPQQRAGKRLALVGDSIASGVVMLGVLGHVQRRFERVEQVEILAPFVTLRGLARLAHYSPPAFRLRVHSFETVLNALPPDYYYSAHYAEPEFHIRPDLEAQYRAWWGSDAAGHSIADTACAGYGWAEAFFNPRKQIQMINEQLWVRHRLTIADVVQRNLAGVNAA